MNVPATLFSSAIFSEMADSLVYSFHFISFRFRSESSLVESCCIVLRLFPTL